MDTSQEVAVIPREKGTSVAAQRQRRSIAEKRRIVEETLVQGTSVARVARAHGINANQVFGWRRRVAHLCVFCKGGDPGLTLPLLPKHDHPSPLIDGHRSNFAVSITPVTAPPPLFRFFHPPALHRIAMHITQLLHSLLLTPDIEAIETMLPNMLAACGKLTEVLLGYVMLVRRFMMS